MLTAAILEKGCHAQVLHWIMDKQVDYYRSSSGIQLSMSSILVGEW